jgi:hypothetical protein
MTEPSVLGCFWENGVYKFGQVIQHVSVNYCEIITPGYGATNISNLPLFSLDCTF